MISGLINLESERLSVKRWNTNEEEKGDCGDLNRDSVMDEN